MKTQASDASKDPACGMTVDLVRAKHQLVHEGKVVAFCSGGCLTKFKAEPARYLHHAPRPLAVVPDEAEYTCPMHLQIVQKGPGPCPICGILPGDPVGHAVGMARIPWIELALSAPVVLWGGWPFFVRAVESVRRLSLNMFTLIGVGTGAAFGYSVVATHAPGLFPPALRGHRGVVDVYFEASAVITTLVLLGQVLELRARGRTGDAIRSLLRLAPKTARRIAESGAEEDVPLVDVRVGDRLRVRPGERVPTDALVVEGRSSVDESMITGEPIPAVKEQGAKRTRHLR